MDKTTQELQRLLIVDDSKVVRFTARKILRDHFEIIEALDGENAWEMLTGEAPFSLVISDLTMPNMDGFELLERIRHSHLPHISDLPVIIITGANDSEAIKERATQAGATDFIGKPFDAVHLLTRAQAHASAHTTVRELREETLALEDESVIDPLTGIANEMAFMERGNQQLAYAIRHDTRLSVFRIEVDNFDTLYKAHGDSAVESIIQSVATVLTTAIRQEDTAARIGAARFALLLPGLNNNSIHNLANRIRKNIKERVLKHKNTRIHYTISIGIAATEIRRDTCLDDLLSMANSRLVYAIANGGDQVVHEGDDCLVPPRQPDTEIASADQAELMDAMETLPAETPVRVEDIEADLPITPGLPNATPSNEIPVPEGRMTDTPSISPDKGIATGKFDSKTVPPEPDQDTSGPLKIPDLALVAETKAVFSLPEELSEVESLAITTDSPPDLPMDQDAPPLELEALPLEQDAPPLELETPPLEQDAPPLELETPPQEQEALALEQEVPPLDATTVATDTSTGYVPDDDTENVVIDNPPTQTTDNSTTHIGILKRLLAGVLSLFIKARKPE